MKAGDGYEGMKHILKKKIHRQCFCASDEIAMGAIMPKR